MANALSQQKFWYLHSNACHMQSQAEIHCVQDVIACRVQAESHAQQWHRPDGNGLDTSTIERLWHKYYGRELSLCGAPFPSD